MPLIEQPDCYVWNSYYVGPDETAGWTGECSDGLAHGEGTLTWRYGDSWVEPELRHSRDDRHQGSWFDPRAASPGLEVISHGSYVSGQREGSWVENRTGSGGETVSEGRYVNGQRHGLWVKRGTYGNGYGRVHDEGPYVNGQREGYWVEHFSTPTRVRIYEGPYVNGQRHGLWVFRHNYLGDESVQEARYVNGERETAWLPPDPFGLHGDGCP